MNLDVADGVMNDTMNNQMALSTPEDEVSNLMQVQRAGGVGGWGCGRNTVGWVRGGVRAFVGWTEVGHHCTVGCSW